MRLDNLVEFVLEEKQADESYNPGDNRRYHPAKADAAKHAPEGPAPTLDNGDTGQGKIIFYRRWDRMNNLLRHHSKGRTAQTYLTIMSCKVFPARATMTSVVQLSSGSCDSDVCAGADPVMRRHNL